MGSRNRAAAKSVKLELGSYADIPYKELGWIVLGDELESRFLATGRKEINGFCWIGFTWHTKRNLRKSVPETLKQVWDWLVEVFSRFMVDAAQVGMDRCRITTAREMPRLIVTLTTV